MQLSYITILALPLLAFSSAIPELFERSGSKQCKQYTCVGTTATLVCCDGEGQNLADTKSGCSAYDNNNSRGPCEDSDIYCCDTFISTTSTGTFCHSASVKNVKCPK